MRPYAKFAPTFWTGPTGKKIKAAGRDAQVMACYLFTCPSSTMYGLYYLPLPTLCHEAGYTEEEARATLAVLATLDFAYYDEEAELVWVVEAARYQVDDHLKSGDNRIKGCVAAIRSFGAHSFAKRFYERYKADFSLPDIIFRKTHTRPFEGASEPLQSQEKEQKQEKEKKQEQETATAAAAGTDRLKALHGVRCPRAGCGHELQRETGQYGHDTPTQGKGWVCSKRTGGCGATYVREDPRVVIQLTDRASAALADEIHAEDMARATAAAARTARQEEAEAALEAYAEAIQPDPAARELWARVLGHLEGSLDRHIYGTWFPATQGMRLDGEELVVRVPSERFRAHIAGNYRGPLDAAMKAAGANGLRLVLQPPPQLSEIARLAAAGPRARRST